MTESSKSSPAPVSVIIDREVLPGKEQAFEEALRGIIDASRAYPGYIGTDVQLPQTHGDRHYRVMFRFSTVDELNAWKQSSERKEWLEVINPLLKAEPEVQVISGLETWFALPKTPTLIPPKRYKMAIITWLAITPLLICFNLLTAPLIGTMGMIPRLLVSTPIIVLLMTYLIMPMMAKLFSRWLYPKQCKSKLH